LENNKKNTILSLYIPFSLISLSLTWRRGVVGRDVGGQRAAGHGGRGGRNKGAAERGGGGESV
jgi:hypothetical protein